MTTSAVHTFQLRTHSPSGKWASNARRYRSYAHELLAELETLTAEIAGVWPAEGAAVIEEFLVAPELLRKCRVRDRTSDSVRVYASMATEGFLNFYGVVRLGQRNFDEHYERLGVVPKLRQLLLVCDSLELPRNARIVMAADAVAGSRNSLVHPKTKELPDGMEVPSQSIRIPDEARRAVELMEEFFEEFLTLVPKAGPIVGERTAA